MKNIKTILLTGGTGFLGSVILKELLDAGYKAVILKRSFSDTSRIKNLLNSKNAVFFDIDRGDLQEIFTLHKIFAVIHAATMYGRRGEAVSDIVESNLFFPLKLLGLAIKHGVIAFLNSDTFSNEKILLPGNEKYYVKTKKDFLDYARGIARNSKLKLMNLKLEHMYGPRDNPTKFIPFVIGEILMGVAEIKFTRGLQKRDFVFVEDAARAYIKVLNHLETLDNYEEFGIGTGKATTLKTAVKTIKEIAGSSVKLIWGGLPYRKNEIMFSRANLANNKKIGWVAETSLEEGFRKTVEGYNVKRKE